MKYRRYKPSYRPEERWRQTTCNTSFIAAYLAALDVAKRTNFTVPIVGFGGWHVQRPGRDVE